MEKLFHARWWDYSQKPMNLHGRIWIGNLILFGLGGVAIVKCIDPPLMAGIQELPEWLLYTLAIATAAIMVSDNIASHIAFNLVKKEIDGVDADDSEEISTKVRQLLKEDPNLKVTSRRIAEKVKEQAELVQTVVEEKKQAAQRRQEISQAVTNVVEETKKSARKSREQRNQKE